MRKANQHIFLLFILLLGWKTNFSQEAKPYRKNAFSFNLTGCLANEINMSYERYISRRKCIQIDGGIIFVNDFLVDQTESWNNPLVFSEHGYAARIHYKIFSSSDNETKKWRDYISPGLIFKHLYYNEHLFTNELNDSKGNYFEYIYQSRIRTKVGIEFLWGKVYELNRTFSFDFFYGGGIVANYVERTVLKRIPDSRKNEIVDQNTTSNNLYFRPNATLGFRFRVRF